MKNKISIKFFSNQKIILIIVLAILLILSFPIINNFNQRNSAEKEINELEKEIESLNKKDEELRKLINYLNSDLYLDEQARLNFNLKKPGEETAVIEMEKKVNNNDIEKKSIYGVPNQEIVKKSKPLTNSQKWINYFLKK